MRSFETGHVDHGRAMALAILTLSSASLTTALGGLRTLTGRIVVVLTVAMSIILTQIPALAAVLDIEPLHMDDWALATAASLAAAGVVWVSQLVAIRQR